MSALEITYTVCCGLMLVITLFLYGYTIHALWLTRRRTPATAERDWPALALVIPCRGLDPDLANNLLRHFHHDYPRYRILFTIADAADPAGPIIEALIRAETRRPAELVVAPRLPHCVEKVSNQIAAFRATGPDDTVIVCADSDGQSADAGWLRALVSALDRCALASGFRWYFPASPGLTGHLQSAWDASWFLIHALGKTTWGGAMAFRRDTYERFEFEKHLSCALTDDLVVQTCTQRAGGQTGYAPGAMMMSETLPHFGDFFRWAVRQAQIVRLVTPLLWLPGFVACNVYVAFYALSAVLLCLPGPGAGWWLPGGAVAVVAASHMLRGLLMYRLACGLFPAHPDRTRPLRWTYCWATPLSDWFVPLILYASLFSSTIRWRGIRYRIEAGRVIRL